MKKQTIKKALPILMGGLITSMVLVPSTKSVNASRYTNNYNVGQKMEYRMNNGTFSSKYQAKLTALNEVNDPTAHIKGFDVRLHAATPYYTVLVVTTTDKYAIEIDAKTGEVMNKVEEARVSVNDYNFQFYYGNKVESNPGYEDNEKEEEADDETPAVEVISQEAAIKKALATIGREATLEEIELDDNVYEIEMYNTDFEYELEIDAVTGEVLSFDIDD